jgi:predicted AlkP superfamily pyrophosphatase or phosphodiesterase
LLEHVIVIDVVGLELEHLQSGLVPNIANLAEQGESFRMEPVFPAVTCTVQASILSGQYPDQHGIVANGLYDRAKYTTSFWEQEDALVEADRVWDRTKNPMQERRVQPKEGSGKKRSKSSPNIFPDIGPSPSSSSVSKSASVSSSSSSSSSYPSFSCFSTTKTAVLFWQNTMYASSDTIVTPRPLHMEDGMVMWCYSKPVGLYDNELTKNFGEFNLGSYWGPFASAKSSEWITKATNYVLEQQRPNLLFTYIPHVDYSAQRHGKSSSQVKDDLKKADDLVESIIEKCSDMKIREATQFIILSEYGFNDVRSAVPLNLELRRAGLLRTRNIQGKEYVDYELSGAFAMVDHQIAHIYVKDEFINKVKRLLQDTDGVHRVCAGQEKKTLKVDHERSGELIAISDRDKWFSYGWWYDSDNAPTFARKVDIHRKPGYDPVELFLDPKTKSIPLDTNLIKSSHGRPVDPETEEGYSVYISNRKVGNIQKKSDSTSETVVPCVDIGKYLIKLVS